MKSKTLKHVRQLRKAVSSHITSLEATHSKAYKFTSYDLTFRSHRAEKHVLEAIRHLESALVFLESELRGNV